MTRKEEMPKRNKEERERSSKDLPFNPDITSEDKKVLNNQSEDEKKGEYFKDREEPIDYAGADLDLPDMDDQQFDPTKNKADATEKAKKQKESANTKGTVEEQSETVYKGEKAEKFKDHSKEEGTKRS